MRPVRGSSAWGVSLIEPGDFRKSATADPHRLDATQVLAHQLHFDDVCVGVKGVPDRIRSTTEGDPIATITRALPGGGLEIFVDSTQDAFGASDWTRTICRGIVEDQEFGFIPDGCDEGVVIR